MSCNQCETLSVTSDKQTVRMTFRRSEIIYHISNDAFIQRQATKASVNVSDLCADGNIEHVERVMRLTMSAIVELMYSATKAELSELPPALDGDGYELKGECDCECDCSDKAFVVVLHIADASATTMRYLYNLIKEVLIDSVLADWLGIVAPDLSTLWQSKAEVATEEISAAINRRMRVGRIKPHWL